MPVSGPSGRMTAAQYELLNAKPSIARMIESGPGYAVMEDEYGNPYRAEGSRPWRNNNPGNVSAATGQFAERRGMVGKDDKKFAAFPTQAAGLQAMRDLLFRPKSEYLGMDTDSLVERYAPAKGGNDVQRYQRFLREKVGDTGTLQSLSPEKREVLMDAMRQMEGYYKGGTITMGDKQWTTTPNRARR